MVRLREDRRDDALTESVIQRIVDGRGGDAEARGGVAIDGDERGKPLVEIVGRHILDIGFLIEPGDQLGNPLVQFRCGSGTKHKGILPAADGGIDGQVLNRLHEQRDAGDAVDLAIETADRIGDVAAALALGFQIDEEASAVQRVVGAIDADEGRQAHHIAVVKKRLGERILPFGHGGE